MRRALRATLPHLPFLQEPSKAIGIVSAIGAASTRCLDDGAAPAAVPDDAGEAAETQTLLESEARALLASYGIPAPRERVVHMRAAAQAAANEIGYPCVLKVVSRCVTHKSDVGGVIVGLPDAEAVGAAYDRICRDVAAAVGPEAVEGMLVAQQILGGTELILGIKRDPEVGPVILLGFGGVLAELLDDVVTAVPPSTPARRGTGWTPPRRPAPRRLSWPPPGRSSRAVCGARRARSIRARPPGSA